MLFSKNIFNDPILGGCWWDKLDESYILKYKKQFLINNQESIYIDLLDILPEFSFFHLDCIIKIKSSTIDDLSYSEKCYILLKYIKSKNKKICTYIFKRKKKVWFWRVQ